jgi:hypothetical protein
VISIGGRAEHRLPHHHGAALLRLCPLALVVSLAIAGCGRMTFSSTFAEDESATHSVEVVFERGGMVEADAIRLQRAIDAAEARATEDGLAVARIDTPAEVGLRVMSTTTDASDVGAALNSLFNSLGVTEGDAPLAPFQGTFQRQSEAVGGTGFELEMTVDGAILYQAIVNVAPGNRQLATPEGVREIIEISYVATMPGTIRDTDGEQLDDNTTRWVIPLDSVSEMSVVSTVGKDSPWGWIVVTIVVALAFVGAAGLGIATLLLRRRNRARAARVPIALHVDASQADATGLPMTEHPETLAEVGSSLARMADRIIAGDELRMGNGAQIIVPVGNSDGEKERPHGADA